MPLCGDEGKLPFYKHFGKLLIHIPSLLKAEGIIRPAA